MATSDSELPAEITAAWIQRHRLGQISHEAKSGIHNPHYDFWFVRLSGNLVLAALGRAWIDLQRRYPVLLCGFDGSRGIWRVGRPAAPSLVTVCAGEGGQAAVEAEVRRPFDLASGPLCRLVVATLQPTIHLAALVVDHLVCDAWSMDRLTTELGRLYDLHLSGGDGDELPPPGLSYPAFVRRENERLDSPRGQRDIAAALAAVEPVGVLPEVILPGFTGRADIDYGRQGRWVGRIEADET